MLILRDHIDREGRGSRCRLCKREGEIALGAFARAAEGGAAGCCSSSDGSPSPHYIRQWQLQHMVHLRPHLLVFFEIDPGDGFQLVGKRSGLQRLDILFCQPERFASNWLRSIGLGWGTFLPTELAGNGMGRQKEDSNHHHGPGRDRLLKLQCSARG